MNDIFNSPFLGGALLASFIATILQMAVVKFSADDADTKKELEMFRNEVNFLRKQNGKLIAFIKERMCDRCV